ncbi:UDP-glycosyltransferase 89B2-like [Aristolochia californica]|uniref:UDP-glycosyltransferase 89B2-like n=1 Tax=Aristolochia californica TaxID=171875 RepID=UPI0035D564E0
MSDAHILVIPYPAQGHLIPLLDHAHQLSSRGLLVTILITPKNLPLLSPLLSNSPSIQTLVLPFPKHPSIPDGIENVKDLPISYFRPMMRALSYLHQPALSWARSHPTPPAAIISDMFLGWTLHLAADLGIPRLVFSPSGAFAISVVNSLWRRMPKLPDNSDSDYPVSFPEIPGAPTYPWWQLSTVYRSYKEGDELSEFIKDGMLANMASWGLVVNSFTELEGKYLEHLRKTLGHPRVWAVGPLHLQPTETNDRGGSSSVRLEDVMTWLEGREEGSVIFICFGSQAVLSRQQMEAVAEGLGRSGVAFVWCVKEATRGHDAKNFGLVPAGFEAEVSDRGLVIKGWAPQVAILSHRSVGVFLSHCGWNSVLEGIVAGVSFLAWPMGADQFLNATLLEESGVAVRVWEGATTVPDAAGLARALAESVGVERPWRSEARELSAAALRAVTNGGSSVKELDWFVEELIRLSEPLTKEPILFPNRKRVATE